MASLMLRAIPIPMASRPITCSSRLVQSEFVTDSLPVARVSVSNRSSSPAYPIIRCGRGDRRTARGKRFVGSYGNARPRNKKKGRGPPRVYAPPGPPRKDDFEDMESPEEEEEEVEEEEEEEDDDEVVDKYDKKK